MVSREVNVNRPEHSWIPFYRELAEKLVNEGWRERQGELVEMLKEMDAGDDLLPSFKDDLESDMDPFTIVASFSRDPRNFDWDKSTRIMRWLKSRFSMASEIPSEPSFIPYANNQQVQYFSFHTPHSIKDDVSNLWDLFEEVVIGDTFQDVSNNERLTDLITRCLRVRGIAISKLTSALYWINPHHFLHRDTVNAVGGADLGIQATDTSNKTADTDSYFKCLVRTAELTERSFSETNIAVFKSENPDWAPPKVWIMRGGRGAVAVDEFRTGGYTGVGFAFGDIDISKFGTVDELSRFCDERSLSHDGIDQVVQFLTDIEISDYVLMPGRGSAVNYYGRVTSDPYHSPSGTHNNRRDVEWSEDKISQSQLDLSGYQHTVTRPNQNVQSGFLEIIQGGSESVDFKMPEDSWVPFHLEVAEKLMEREWWLPEKREALDDMIEKVRWSDPDEVSDDYEHIQWTPDPYSFYLSFNMRTDGTKRLPGYRMVQELLDVGANVPDADHRVRGLGTHYRFTNPPGDDDIDALWDFFRFVTRFEPTEDEGAAEFVEKYDRVIEVNGFVGQWDITLSYWLYWIDPRKYLLTRRLHRQELGLAAELGLPENINGGQQYLQALRATRSFAESKRKSLLDINRESTTREMLGLNGDIDHEGDIEDERIAYTIDDMVNDDDLFFEPGELRRMHSRFEDKKNLILQGPPGVGKTFVLKRLAYALMGEQADRRMRNVQFHQSYSYEEFVQGYRPDTNEQKQLIFEMQHGTFLELCVEARDNPDDRYVMVIDEINRGNLSRVFGELLSMIEKDKRGDRFKIRLAGGNEFWVPENVYILGTMNLADRSLAGMDYAMRRRFAFVTLEPQFGKAVFKDWMGGKGVPEGMITQVNDGMKALNDEIADPKGPLGRNFAVGHSHFCDIADDGEEDWEGWYREIVKTEIQPLLEEYWFDDLTKADDEVGKLLEGID